MNTKWLKSGWTWGIGLILVIVVGIPILMSSGKESSARANRWHRMASPGDLSLAHAHLENNCAACHSPVKGIEATSCILCHANNETLLQRQPTAFHADIDTCHQCHLEHRGRHTRPTNMDHVLLAQLGVEQLDRADVADSESHQTASRLRSWIDNDKAFQSSLESNHRLTAQETVLNCAACHGNDDRHFDLFGSNCAACHGAASWTIPEFQHPSPTSMDCAQCHQAPPSHYMMHFNMISQKVAGKPKARIDQCYACHQTTSWPDIKGIGWYKHH